MKDKMKAAIMTAMAGILVAGASMAEEGHGDPAAAEKKAKVVFQTTCPVMGGKINKKQYVDVKGKRIYVCCPGCIGKIKADPDKYIQKLAKDGVAMDAAPKPAQHGSEQDDHKGHNH